MSTLFKLKKAKQYEKWKKLLLMKWERDNRKMEIFNGEVIMESIEASELHGNTVAAYKRAELSMKEDVIANLCTEYANDILEVDDFVDMWDRLAATVKGEKSVRFEKVKRDLRYMKLKGLEKTGKKWKLNALEYKRNGGNWSNNELVEELFKLLPSVYDNTILYLRRELQHSDEDQFHFDNVLEELKLAEIQFEKSRKKKEKFLKKRNVKFNYNNKKKDYYSKKNDHTKASK